MKATPMRTLFGCAVVFLLVAGSSVLAANSRVGTSAFPFLKINVGARAVGMGGAFTGLADDESALYYNPAGTATLTGDRFIAGYHNFVDDIQNGFLGFSHEMKEGHVLSGYISYLDYGTFTETTSDGDVLGEFGGSDMLFAATYAMTYNESFRFGGTVKFIYEKLEDFSATGVAVDLGARYNSFRSRYMAGLAIQNLGVQLTALGEDKESLPITVRAGGAARPKGLPLLLAGDVIIPVDNDPDIAVGAEYYELKPLYLRMGWNSFGSNYRTADSDDKAAGLSFGVGFDIRKLHVAYAVTLAAELGESHRITLTGGI